MLTLPDNWPSKYNAQNDLPRLVQELFGAGEHLEYHFRGNSVGDAVLWIYV
jgi:hypothetical protein